jgi:hypothetical protein
VCTLFDASEEETMKDLRHDRRGRLAARDPEPLSTETRRVPAAVELEPHLQRLVDMATD